MDILEQLRTLGLVALAGALGAIIGIEREIAEKPAGLRTHLLVAAAAALLVVLSRRAILVIGHQLPPESIQADPIRIVQAVVLGISFLGAGTIFIRRGTGNVEGLTTAASILMSAALGIAVGLGEVLLATMIALLVVTVLWTVGHLERRFLRDRATASAGQAVPQARGAPREA